MLLWWQMFWSCDLFFLSGFSTLHFVILVFFLAFFVFFFLAFFLFSRILSRDYIYSDGDWSCCMLCFSCWYTMKKSIFQCRQNICHIPSLTDQFKSCLLFVKFALNVIRRLKLIFFYRSVIAIKRSHRFFFHFFLHSIYWSQVLV